MNKLIPLLISFTVVLFSCNKKDNYRGNAQILGYDGTYCACCGGFMIKVEGDNSNNYYLARTLPSNAGINPMSSFPINVELDYDKNDKNCDQVITVTRIRKK